MAKLPVDIRSSLQSTHWKRKVIQDGIRSENFGPMFIHLSKMPQNGSTLYRCKLNGNNNKSQLRPLLCRKMFSTHKSLQTERISYAQYKTFLFAEFFHYLVRRHHSFYKHFSSSAIVQTFCGPEIIIFLLCSIEIRARLPVVFLFSVFFLDKKRNTYFKWDWR